MIRAMATREMGVTLIELLVVLAILGVMAGIVGLAWHPGPWPVERARGGNGAIAEALRYSVESGKAVRVHAAIAGRSVSVMAFPDGRVVGAGQYGVNPLTGEDSDAPTTHR